MAVYCFTQLIQPGKREEAKAVFDEIRETLADEASRRRLGIREQRGCGSRPCPRVIWPSYTGKATIRAPALQEFASSTDPFDEWLIERGRVGGGLRYFGVFVFLKRVGVGGGGEGGGGPGGGTHAGAARVPFLRLRVLARARALGQHRPPQRMDRRSIWCAKKGRVSSAPSVCI